jgi:hypothetical protein
MEIEIGFETKKRKVLLGETATPLTLFVAVSAI